MGETNNGKLPEALFAAENRMTLALDDLAAEVPEVAASRETIEAHGRNLITDLDIKPEFFDKGRAHMVFFSALACRSSQAEASKEAMGEEAYLAEHTFITSAGMLLVRHESGRFEEFRHQIDQADIYDEAQITGIYNQYANTQVGAELQAAIDSGGLLDDVKQRLRITEDNEDPYELRVLNIGDWRTLYGTAPIVPDYGTPEWEQWRADDAAYQGYKADLEENGKAFMEATGMHEIPLAWCITLNGTRYLNIALPTAEKILHPDKPRPSFYTESHRLDELATLGHEYVHTQGYRYGLDDSVYYGISLEERHAELMSGDRMGYKDARGFWDIDFVLLTGANIRHAMQQAEKGGHADRLFPSLANVIGLQRTLEVGLTVPEKYLKDWRPLQKAVNEYLGGVNGLEARLYQDNKEATDERLREWAEQSTADLSSWYAIRRGVHKLAFMTDKMAQAQAARRPRQ